MLILKIILSYMVLLFIWRFCALSRPIEGFQNNTDKKKVSDFLPPGKYLIHGSQENIDAIAGKKINSQVTYVTDFMIFTNLDHDIKSKYKYNKTDKTYIDIINKNKYLIYDSKSEPRTIKIFNNEEIAIYNIIIMEQTKTQIKQSTDADESQLHNDEKEPISYLDTINSNTLNSASLSQVQENTANITKFKNLLDETSTKNKNELLDSFLTDYYIGYSEKDTWVLSLTKEDNALLKKAFPISRTEQLNMRDSMIPLQEKYNFSLLSTLQLYMKSVTTKQKSRLLNILQQLRIIVEGRTHFEKGNIFEML